MSRGGHVCCSLPARTANKSSTVALATRCGSESRERETEVGRTRKNKRAPLPHPSPYPAAQASSSTRFLSGNCFKIPLDQRCHHPHTPPFTSAETHIRHIHARTPFPSIPTINQSLGVQPRFRPQNGSLICRDPLRPITAALAVDYSANFSARRSPCDPDST